MMWKLAMLCFVVISVMCLLGLSSEKVMNRNWIASLWLIASALLGYMAGQS